MEPEKWTVKAADEYLNNIPKFSTEKHSAEDIRSMLSYMNILPEKEKIIHVAGTNGKGSVCAFLDSILTKCGKQTARFTSPHLMRVTERFSFDGKNVDDELFLKAFEEVKASYSYFEDKGLGHPTYFEYLFLMFMWMVSQKNVEYVILETGLGGRLDATNCIEHPILTIITSISLDHMEYLGNTVTKIAGEKAGILKRCIPVVYDDTDAAASEVIKNRARELSCRTFPINTATYTDLTHVEGGMSLKLNEEQPESTYQDAKICKELFIPFEAEYQAVNACIAYKAALLLGVDADCAAKGISNALWHGRMEKISDGIYIDGAHNEGGIRAFADAAYVLSEARKRKNGKRGRVYLLFAAVTDKNYESMLGILMKKLEPELIVLTHLSTSRALPIEKMKTSANRLAENAIKECKIKCIPDLHEAYKTLILEKQPEDICFCVGSLYLVGELESIIFQGNL